MGTTVVVPHVIRVVGSYSADVQPFRRFNADDPNLASKLEDLFSGDNVKVVRNYKDVPEDEATDKEFLSMLDARSWKGLYQKCNNWQVSRREGRFTIERFKASPFNRGMEADQEATNQIEQEMSLDRAVAFFVRELRTTVKG